MHPSALTSSRILSTSLGSWKSKNTSRILVECWVSAAAFYFEGGFGGLGVQIGIYEIENEMSFSVNVLCTLLLSRLKCFLVI